jgi:hypothetical protein
MGLALRPSLPQDGRASLHLAAYQGHIELVKLLLAKGANVTATTAVRVGRTARVDQQTGGPALWLCAQGRVRRAAVARARAQVAPATRTRAMRCCRSRLPRPPDRGLG